MFISWGSPEINSDTEYYSLSYNLKVLKIY
jgi:hypothetical protein